MISDLQRRRPRPGMPDAKLHIFLTLSRRGGEPFYSYVLTWCLGKFLVVDFAKQDIREIQQDAKDAAKAAAAQAAHPVSAGVNGTTCVAGHQQDFVSCCTAFMAHVCGDVV